MKDSRGIDHITLCVQNLDAIEYLFTKILGFDVLWSARNVGTDLSGMDTVVVTRGQTKVVLMQGRDKSGPSQISEFVRRFGAGVQHFAIEVEDIDRVSQEWEAKGVQFTGPIKEGRDGLGQLRQRFTYPLLPGTGLFLELIQRNEGEDSSNVFDRENVEALYRDIERNQLEEIDRTIIDFQTLPLPFPEPTGVGKS